MGQTERTLSLEHDGKVYNLTAGDFTAVDDLEIFRTCGLTLTDVFARGRVSLFSIAALVWRYRVNDGEEDLTYLEVARTFSYDTIQTVSGTPAEDPSPEA